MTLSASTVVLRKIRSQEPSPSGLIRRRQGQHLFTRRAWKGRWVGALIPDGVVRCKTADDHAHSQRLDSRSDFQPRHRHPSRAQDHLPAPDSLTRRTPLDWGSRPPTRTAPAGGASGCSSEGIERRRWTQLGNLANELHGEHVVDTLAGCLSGH